MKQLALLLALIACTFVRAQDDQLADAYFEDGAYEKSLTLSLKQYRRFPDKARFDRVLRNYQALEEWKKAELFTRKHLKKTASDPGYFLVELAVILRNAKDEQGEQEALEELFEMVAQSPGRVYPIARLLEKRQLYQAALDAYQTAEKGNPSLRFHYQKAQLQGELGDVESVFRELLLLVEQNPAYLNTVRQLAGQSLGEDPEDPTNVFLKEQLLLRIQATQDPVLTELLTWVFLQERNFRGAFRQLRGLDIRLDRQQRELFDLAGICMENEEFATAQQIFEYIIGAGEVSPVYLPAQAGRLEAMQAELFANPSFSRASVEMLSAEYREVLQGLPRHLDLAPAYRAWYRMLAFQLGDTTQALDGLKALSEWPDPQRTESDETAMATADVLTFSGRHYEAILYYARIEKERPGTDLADRAKFSRAKVAFYQSEFNWAENLFEALKFSVSKRIANDAMEYSILIRDNVGLDTNTEALSLYSKAELLYFRQRYDEALSILEDVRVGFYEHSLQDEVLWMEARIHKSRGDRALAVSVLTEILNEHSDDILADNALMMLGRIQENEGLSNEAQATYERLLTEHSDSFFISEARKRIRILRGETPL
ncbi:MAG: Uncharacterised protein [Flavobacteriia bacterium]|nr:MAG: Uncharacterised protein [Flavobacteriia bacterium]